MSLLTVALPAARALCNNSPTHHVTHQRHASSTPGGNEDAHMPRDDTGVCDTIYIIHLRRRRRLYRRVRHHIHHPPQETKKTRTCLAIPRPHPATTPLAAPTLSGNSGGAVVQRPSAFVPPPPIGSRPQSPHQSHRPAKAGKPLLSSPAASQWPPVTHLAAPPPRQAVACSTSPPLPRLRHHLDPISCPGQAHCTNYCETPAADRNAQLPRPAESLRYM